MPNKGKSTNFIRRLKMMLNSQIIAWVETPEEERFLKLFRRICQRKHDNHEDFHVFSWSISEGLLDCKRFMVQNASKMYDEPSKVMIINQEALNISSSFGNSSGEPPQIQVTSFRDTYDYIMKNNVDHIYIIKDFHNFFGKSTTRNDYPENVRRLKDIIYHIRKRGNLIFLGPESNLPIDILNDIHVIEMPRPDDEDVSALLDESLSSMKNEVTNLQFCIDFTNQKGKIISSKHPESIALRQKFLYNLRGLTETEITQIICYATVKNQGLNETALDDITDYKREKIAQFDALEFIPTPDHITVGGHSNYKRYIDQRGLYLQPHIRSNYNLKPPKGSVVLGLPGAGKSILAKYISLKWSVPLIRMDMGAIYGQYLGQSESRLREALRIAEANAPCILWVDEIEKAIGGGSESSGTSTRILGKLLTWLAEREEMVYVYATANNIDKIPPELLRTGRFDTIRWADLPTLLEANEIISIHCSKNGLQLKNEDILKLATISVEQQLTPSEIEQAIINANFDAAAQSEQMGVLIPVTSHFVEHNLMTARPWVNSHREDLYKWRQSALKNYEFTSDEVRSNVQKWVDNETAHRKEHNN